LDPKALSRPAVDLCQHWGSHLFVERGFWADSEGFDEEFSREPLFTEPSSTQNPQVHQSAGVNPVIGAVGGFGFLEGFLKEILGLFELHILVELHPFLVDFVDLLSVVVATLGVGGATVEKKEDQQGDENERFLGDYYFKKTSVSWEKGFFESTPFSGGVSR